MNTIPGMALDVETRKPRLANITGGLSGPAIHPVAVRAVWEVSRAVTVPIIGGGGIMNGPDAMELILAGASAVTLGTAMFIDPDTPARILEYFRSYLVRHRQTHLQDLVGGAVV